LQGHFRQPIVLGPGLRTFEISRLNDDPMQVDLAIKIKSNPFAGARPGCALNPGSRTLAIDRIGRVVSIGLHCQPHR
jgi:hypothetical protein